MSDCAFCRIARNPHRGVLWHDDDRMVFSMRPFGAVTPLHRMFIPVQHVADAAEDPEVTGECFAAAARWGAEKGQPFNLTVNSGAPAGQSVFHLHVHYVPRARGDGLGYRWHPKEEEK